jgi:hypothetical protein
LFFQEILDYTFKLWMKYLITAPEDWVIYQEQKENLSCTMRKSHPGQISQNVDNKALKI